MEEDAQPSHTAHSLSLSLDHLNRRRPYKCPSRTIITSFSPARRPHNHHISTTTTPYEEGDWILCLATDNQNRYTSTPTSLACALSNGDVQVYDAQRFHLQRTFPTTTNHQTNPPSIITDLQYGPQPSLVATHQNGTLQIMDVRQAPAVAHQTCLPSSALCLSLGYDQGHVCAVGSTKGRIHFVDLRQLSSSQQQSNTQSSSQALLGTYHQSHREDVTCVRFATASAASSSLLLSGGDDGLMCLLDTTQPTEEAALKSVLNVGAPIRHAGFCGNHLYCLTGNETLSVWNGDTGRVLQTTTRHDLLGAATTTTMATTTTHSSLGQNGYHHHHNNTTNNDNFGWNSIDYLVDAHWDEVQQQLVLLAGGQTTRASVGCSALFAIPTTSPVANEHSQEHLSEQVLRSWRSPQQSSMSLSTTSTASTVSVWNHGNNHNDNHLQHVESLAVGGHAGVIRAWCPLGPHRLLTAGEDARLCEWTIGNNGSSNNNVATTPANTMVGTKRPGTGSGGGGGPVRQRQRHTTSNAPY